MSRAFSLAGFELTLIGRIWVTPEGSRQLRFGSGQVPITGTLALALFVAAHSDRQTHTCEPPQLADSPRKFMLRKFSLDSRTFRCRQSLLRSVSPGPMLRIFAEGSADRMRRIGKPAQ